LLFDYILPAHATKKIIAFETPKYGFVQNYGAVVVTHYDMLSGLFSVETITFFECKLKALVLDVSVNKTDNA